MADPPLLMVLIHSFIPSFLLFFSFLFFSFLSFPFLVFPFLSFLSFLSFLFFSFFSILSSYFLFHPCFPLIRRFFSKKLISVFFCLDFDPWGDSKRGRRRKSRERRQLQTRSREGAQQAMSKGDLSFFLLASFSFSRVRLWLETNFGNDGAARLRATRATQRPSPFRRHFIASSSPVRRYCATTSPPLPLPLNHLFANTFFHLSSGTVSATSLPPCGHFATTTATSFSLHYHFASTLLQRYFATTSLSLCYQFATTALPLFLYLASSSPSLRRHVGPFLPPRRRKFRRNTATLTGRVLPLHHLDVV